MKLEILEKLDPKLREKIRKDFDLHEIRGESFGIIEKWLEKALLIEATMRMLRAGVLEITGLKEYPPHFYEPSFRFVLPNLKKSENDVDKFEDDDISFEEE
jgi:hypothetical protein